MGNQKWNGAIPIFIIKEEQKIKSIIVFKFSLKLYSIKKQNKIIENNSKLEANACVRKYFKIASLENKLFIFMQSGIKERRLISKPIHILNHEDDEILIIVPKNREKMNNILYEFFKIFKNKKLFIFLEFKIYFFKNILNLFKLKFILFYLLIIVFYVIFIIII